MLAEPVKRPPPTSPTSPCRAAARIRPALQRVLGRWFRAERRDLPWRRTRDPYAVWISETMLQQTRVETVIPYYQRFLARFPDVAALAAAAEDEVLALWSGLGYYSRARALRRAARAVLTRHGGQLPRTREQWLELPGVGPYTAGAVLSIARSQSEPLVDGNVQRVLARLFALEHRLGSADLVASAWALARVLVPGRGAALDPGDWNQGLMELGARVCRARAPRCAECPLRAHCRAHASDREHELPRPRARRAPLEVRLEVLVARARGLLLLVRRPPSGRMAGLHELPTRELAAGRGRALLWPRRLPRGLEPELGDPLGELAHSITHHRIRATVRPARLSGRLPAGMRWVGAEELAGLALTGLARKALALPSVLAGASAAGTAGGDALGEPRRPFSAPSAAALPWSR